MKFKEEPSTAGAQDHLKLKDKESRVGVFRGDPLEFYSVWNNSKSTPSKKGEPGARFRFKVNFVTKDEGQNYVALVWEQGPTVYNLLKSLNEDYPLENTVMKITRFGSTKDTTSYTILPIPKGHEVTPALEAMLAKVKLNELHAGPAQVQEAEPEHFDQSFAPTAQHEEQLPF